MDVDKRPPVTGHQSTLPPPPQDLNLPQIPHSVPSIPPSIDHQEVISEARPPLVLERPRQNDAGMGEPKGQPSPPSPVAANAEPPGPMSPFSMNLISSFKLDPLAATVARFDPTSGEKINKMRKSYENYLKTFGLVGKNRSVKHEEAAVSLGGNKLMSMSEMTAWPEEEWQMQKVHGKDIKKGLSESLKGKLEKAFTMNPGSVPDQAKWDDILGIDRPNPNVNSVKSRKEGAGTLVNGQSNTASSAAPVANSDANANAGSDHIRARRNTKKRRYDDGSFEGYGEGFVDDEMDNDGYESGETYTSRNSRGSKGDRKRRKTQDFGKSGQSGPSRTGSFASAAGYGR